jgi:hypothetical protein
VGFANSRNEAPWDRPNTDFVFLNELWEWLQKVQAERKAKGLSVPDWSAWFELHDDTTIGVRTTLQDQTPTQAAHLEWMRKQPAGRPIFMQRVHDDIPASVAYPYEEMSALYAKRIPAFQRYFTSSIGFMLAWGIKHGRDDNFAPVSSDYYSWIGLYGIDLGGDTEYVHQRPNTEFFAGFAAGLGIEIMAHPDSALFRGECVYGYEQPPYLSGPLNANFLGEQCTTLKREIAKCDEIIGKQTAVRNTLHGALQAQESNIKMLVDYAKRGIGPRNLTRTSELLTPGAVTPQGS